MAARLAMVTARRRNHFAPGRVSGDGKIEGKGMFHKKTKVDDSSKRLGVALLAAALILVVAAPHAPAQKARGRKLKTRSASTAPQVSKEDAKKMTEAASQSRANLLSASSAYRDSLEKLL